MAQQRKILRAKTSASDTSVCTMADNLDESKLELKQTSTSNSDIVLNINSTDTTPSVATLDSSVTSLRTLDSVTCGDLVTPAGGGIPQTQSGLVIWFFREEGIATGLFIWSMGILDVVEKEKWSQGLGFSRALSCWTAPQTGPLKLILLCFCLYFLVTGTPISHPLFLFFSPLLELLLLHVFNPLFYYLLVIAFI